MPHTRLPESATWLLACELLLAALGCSRVLDDSFFMGVGCVCPGAALEREYEVLLLRR